MVHLRDLGNDHEEQRHITHISKQKNQNVGSNFHFNAHLITKSDIIRIRPKPYIIPESVVSVELIMYNITNPNETDRISQKYIAKALPTYNRCP